MLTFRIGDVYPAEDPVARWLTTLAISHNDIRHNTLQLLDPGQPAHEALYSFRLLASHYREIAEDLQRTYDEWEEIREFVDGLPARAQTHLRAILETASHMDGELGRLRNTLFHYPELDRRRSAVGREQLQQAMRRAAAIRGTIASGSSFQDGRFDYADEVIVQFLGDGEMPDQLMGALQRASVAFWEFCHLAHERWLSSLDSGAFTIQLMPPTQPPP